MSTHKTTDFLFRIGLIGKGIDSLFEIAGGVLLTMPVRLARLFAVLSDHELYKHHKVLAGHIDHLATVVQLHGTYAQAAYLILHGLAKAVLITAIFRGKRWGYTGLIAVLSLFTVIEFGRAIFAREIVTGMLGGFDLAIIVLIAKEYRYRFSRSEG